MEHYSDRKYRGPETWAKVREAYLAGETGPVVAKRFDVGLANLRKRAMAEGWTRRRFALTIDAKGRRRMKALPPPETSAPEAPPAPEPALAEADPETALAAATAQASALLVAGRAAEATAILKAAESLARLTGAAPGKAAEPEREWGWIDGEWVPEPGRLTDAELSAVGHRLSYADWQAIERRALELLRDECNLPSGVSPFAFAWRARHLGPKVAAADHRRAVAGGWAGHYWNEEGRLKDVYALMGYGGRLWPAEPIDPADLPPE